MTLANTIVNGSIKQLTRMLCRIDDQQLSRVPPCGPCILVANHVNSLEVPLIYTHLMPRQVTGFAKAETWNNPAMRLLFDFWGAIPIKRGKADIEAMRSALAALRAGKILAVAPEGTRSNDGMLRRGHPGIVTLALYSNAPLLPVVYFGGELLRKNLVRLRRTEFNIVVGQPFRVTVEGEKVTRQLRQRITDEIMYQLAALLPPRYRGYYVDLHSASERYLTFMPPAQSNLLPNRH